MKNEYLCKFFNKYRNYMIIIKNDIHTRPFLNYSKIYLNYWNFIFFLNMFNIAFTELLKNRAYDVLLINLPLKEHQESGALMSKL